MSVSQSLMIGDTLIWNHNIIHYKRGSRGKIIRFVNDGIYVRMDDGHEVYIDKSLLVD